jgi:hypothetical protein
MTNEGPLELPEILEMGRQLFFGIGVTMLASTILWIVVFLVLSVTRMNGAEL